MTATNQPTLQHVLDAINDFASNTERRLTWLEQNVVTKEYLDRYMTHKLAEFREENNRYLFKEMARRITIS